MTTSSSVPPRPTRPGRRSRGAAVAALAVAGALTLGGCQWTSTVQTERQYVPADGWSAQVGSLDLRNVLVVADKKGGPGNVVGMLANTGDSPVDVTVSGAQGDKITVAPKGTEQFTVAGGRTTTLPSVDAAPGALTTLRIGTNAGNTDIQVPVVAPNSYYSTLAPSASASPSASSGSSAPASSPTETAAPAPAGTESPATPGTTGEPSPTGTTTAG